MSEKVNKTVAALLGASAMIFLHIIPQDEAYHSIDLNVIFLLVGMMIIVHIMSKTGVFQYVAIKLAQIGRGEPLRIMILLGVAAALISALLDNVTTMILMAPVTFLISDELEIDPVPFLILMAISSNIGGTATLVGDPPNILIGSAAGLSFNDFLFNLTPVIAIIMVAYVFTVKWLFRKSFNVSSDLKARVREIVAIKAIRNWPLLIQSLVVLGSVIGLFLFHHLLGLEAATIALAGAAVLTLISKIEPDEYFQHIEWTTIFFFIGLFIIVEGLVKIGFIEMVANGALSLTKGDMKITTLFILWFSAIFSAVVDNIPYTATMIPIIKHLGASIADQYNVIPPVILKPLWWSLALGACLGGNGTVIGASANVIIVGIAKKNGHHISFFHFMKYGIIFTLESMIISTVYVYFRYLISF
jgi:Na+/H+ antiporter NhaD/arsenite permease-like protein